MSNFDDDEFEEWDEPREEDNGKMILIVSIIVAAVIFLVILGVSSLGQECVKGHESSCTAYEKIEKGANWLLDR